MKFKKIFDYGVRKVKSAAGGTLWYARDFSSYKERLEREKRKVVLKFWPEVFDKDPVSHTFDKHYVYMDSWALRGLIKDKPSQHIDVGSSVRFLSMASAVVPLKFVDIRPLKLDLPNFEGVEGSVLELPFESNSVESLSCLHVAEHIGLGRYGDPLDIDGTKKACKELSRVLKPGGKLYFALPIGKEVTYFNAHRVHNPQTILDYFSDLELVSFSAIGDDGHFVENADWIKYQHQEYACGCFEFKKPLP